MANTSQKYQWQNSRLAQLIRQRIADLLPAKSQREVAAEIGYDKPHALSMYKRGEAKVPLERLPAFARALDVDLGLLFRLWLEQNWPGEENAITKMVAERVVTENDRALMKLIRTYLQVEDREVALDLLERLRGAFADRYLEQIADT